jgi:DNA-binding NtrC family response regulator
VSENHIVFLVLDNQPAGEFWSKLSAGGFTPRVTTDPAEALSLIATLNADICVCLSDSPSKHFLDVIRSIAHRDLDAKVIVATRASSVDDAVRYMKAGAHDFINSSDGGNARLVESILRVATNYRQPVPPRKEIAASAAQGSESVLVGQSPAICEIRSAVNLIAKSQTTVLITGESGTGKEVVARLIHRQSPRRDAAYVTVNCAAIPKDVIENELFGHEKGAFTGAILKKAGCFEMADNGTILLDEIAEMSNETQAKLLRAIETQKFRRLGGKEEINVDVRIIAATNKLVSQALKDGELREDLYYRLSVIELLLPPIRERREDIPMLIDYFFSFFAKRYEKPPQAFSPEALEILTAYEWPGNVREIRNAVERAIVVCPHAVIAPHYLPERITARPAAPTHIRIPVGSSTQEAERMLILETLASAGYNKTKAARILGVSRKTLHNKLAGFRNPL